MQLFQLQGADSGAHYVEAILLQLFCAGNLMISVAHLEIEFHHLPMIKLYDSSSDKVLVAA